MMRAARLLACVATGVVQLAQAQTAPRTVSGRVFDDTTGCPLRGAQIQAVGATGHAVTDVQGRYRLGILPDSSFVLQVARAGYRSQQTLTMNVADPSARVDFSLVRVPADSAGRVAYSRRTCQLEPPDDRP